MKKRILVTGGAGYVGSVLTRNLLAEGYEVTVLDSLRSGGASLLELLGESNFSFVKSDIRDPKTVREALRENDTVVHLAGIVGQPACNKNPKEAYEVNQLATMMLYDLATEMKIPRFIFASTCSNYGMLGDKVATEETPVEATSIYANTKIESEKYILSKKTLHTSPTILRFATAFGISPRMRIDLLVHEFLRDAIYKKQILVYGPEYWRPLVHVKDIAKAVILCAQAPSDKISHQIFNVGNEKNNIRKIDLAKLIGKYVPTATIEAVPTEQDLRNYYVSFHKISNVLGYSVTKTLDEGILEVKRAIVERVIDPYDEALYYNS